jgi:hypothetical protein
MRKVSTNRSGIRKHGMEEPAAKLIVAARINT